MSNLPLSSKKIVAKLLDPYTQFLEAKNITLKETTVLSLISKAKAKGQNPDDLFPSSPRSHPPTQPRPGYSDINDINYVVSQVYREYERTLRRNNSLDFDDLLLFGVKLFSEHPNSVSWCRHILVDEL